MAAFVDTNIIFYAFVPAVDGEREKAAIAKRLIDQLTEEENLVVSAQVLGEFAATAMRKSKSSLTQVDVKRIVEMLTRETVIPIDASLVQLALHRVEQSRLSYWDALIVEAALRSGASILYTEDMHHGTRYDTLELRNPFLA